MLIQCNFLLGYLNYLRSSHNQSINHQHNCLYVWCMDMQQNCLYDYGVFTCSINNPVTSTNFTIIGSPALLIGYPALLSCVRIGKGSDSQSLDSCQNNCHSGYFQYTQSTLTHLLHRFPSVPTESDKCLN